MHVDIVFSGLCSFLNVDGSNSTMGDPGVIAVQTPPGENPPHIPFIAYNKLDATVDDSAGFQNVVVAPECSYLEIGGFEISIVGQTPSTPTVDQSYSDFLVRKDDYWPEAKDQWNRDYVPKSGDKPKTTAVKFYMRFGPGTLSAGRVSLVRWQFPRRGGAVFLGNFAEEVVYGFAQADSPAVVELRNLGDSDQTPAVRTLKFSPRVAGAKLTLFIGSNTASDMGTAVRRITVVRAAKQSDHFKYLNAVSSLGMDGPIPVAINPFPSGSGGGGENGGPCGPVSANN